jgi:hypothetical protein
MGATRRNAQVSHDQDHLSQEEAKADPDVSKPEGPSDRAQRSCTRVDVRNLSTAHHSPEASSSSSLWTRSNETWTARFASEHRCGGISVEAFGRRIRDTTTPAGPFR